MGSIVLLKVKLFIFFVFRLIFLLKVNKGKKIKEDNADFLSGNNRSYFWSGRIFALIPILHDFIFHLIGKKLVVWINAYTSFPQHFLFTFYQRVIKYQGHTENNAFYFIIIARHVRSRRDLLLKFVAYNVFIALLQITAEWQSGEIASDMKVYVKKWCFTELLCAEKKCTH